MEKRYYIAYGSNLNVQQMRMRCPSARIIGTSVLEDHKRHPVHFLYADLYPRLR